LNNPFLPQHSRFPTLPSSLPTSYDHLTTTLTISEDKSITIEYDKAFLSPFFDSTFDDLIIYQDFLLNDRRLIDTISDSDRDLICHYLIPNIHDVSIENPHTLPTSEVEGSILAFLDQKYRFRAEYHQEPSVDYLKRVQDKLVDCLNGLLSQLSSDSNSFEFFKSSYLSCVTLLRTSLHSLHKIHMFVTGLYLFLQQLQNLWRNEDASNTVYYLPHEYIKMYECLQHNFFRCNRKTVDPSYFGSNKFMVLGSPHLTHMKGFVYANKDLDTFLDIK